MFRRKLGFEGPTNLFLKRVSKSLIRLCSQRACIVIRPNSIR